MGTNIQRGLGAVAAMALASVAAGQSGVTIAVDQFGVGSTLRPGTMTGLRLKLTSNLDDPTPVWVQWEAPNADGDIGEYGRSLTLTPGQPAFAWLYAPLLPDMDPESVWTVRVFEERDGVRRAEVGGARISPTPAPGSTQSAAQVVDISTNLIAVVGDRRLGLDDFTVQAGQRGARPIGAHEDTRIVSGIRPVQLPDRWFGLLPFEAVVWAGSNVPPQDLGLEQAAALREYVQRGGHLVIVLPASGNPWGLGAVGQTLLEDVLPCRTVGRTPRQDEAVKLEALLPVLSKFRFVTTLVGRKPQPEFTLRVFKDLRGDFNVIDNAYEPLIALPDGRVIAIQRVVGLGRVTVIGLDLADGRLEGLLPQGDAFWNRVLGRRADTPNVRELQVIQAEQRLAHAAAQDNNLQTGRLITTGTGGINMSHTAGMGLLLAIVLFIAYWLTAGPGGFALLKHHGVARHSWVAFALCAALFTLVAWGSVELLPKPHGVRHITILDHVARPPDDPRSGEPQYQRGVSYFSVYLPRYGRTPLAIDSTGAERDVLASWSPPGDSPQRFPNVARFRVDVARSAAQFALPSRATSTNLYAHWTGALDPEWGGLLRPDPVNPPRVVLDPTGREQALTGAVLNELPDVLTNVTVIWIQNSRTPRRIYAMASGREQAWTARSGSLLNNGQMWALKANAAWSPGQPLDLGRVSASGGAALSLNIQQKYISPYLDRDLGLGASMVRDDERRRIIEMLSLFQQLDPPSYLKAGPAVSDPSTALFHRTVGRELDLSPWFVRPCVIIIGYLEHSAMPVPLRIDGERPRSDGLTVVRWIYPLPVIERAAFADVFESAADEVDGP